MPGSLKQSCLARAGAAVAATLLLTLVAACGSTDARPSASHGAPSGSPGSSSASEAGPSVSAPGRMTGPLLSPDVLIYSSRTLAPSVVGRIHGFVRGLGGATAAEQFSMAQFYRQETPVVYAAVNPASFRRWTLSDVAQSSAVWDRVADGELAIDPAVAKQVQSKGQFVKVGDNAAAPVVHIGAYAQLFDPANKLGVDAVFNQRWAGRLGMVPGNAMLVSTGNASPQSVQKKLRAIAGSAASVRILGFDFDPNQVQTVVLTGEVNAAVGTYNYTLGKNGWVIPSPAWVREYIRTVQVPIIGTVTCNKVMLPQLIGALTEIQRRGLSDLLHANQYGGCFVPKLIPGSNVLSYHAFGLAVDFNVPGNQRGTRGQMDRRIVEIMTQWGFEWGGYWHYTDPMHFQLDRVVDGQRMQNPD